MVMPNIEDQVTAFHRGKQQVVFDFLGEDISSDGGVLLMKKVSSKMQIINDVAKLIPDKRDPLLIKYTYKHLLEQRIFQLAQGYQDCNDAKYLHDDPVMQEALGGDLSSQPTLSRLENMMTRKALFDISEAWVDRYVASIKPGRKKVVLDIDSTDDPAHGGQQMVMFNAFYHQHQLDQLLFFDGETGQLVLPVLRPGNSHTARWAFAILKRIIKKIRARFPDMCIEIRLDAGFSCPELYKLVDEYKLVYAAGIPANNVLKGMVSGIQKEIKETYVDKGEPFQFITDGFEYQAESWDAPQTVYAKIESTGKGLNTRFFCSNFEDMTGDKIYWKFYVCRGETCENRIKEFKNMCFSGRLSCHSFWANSLRMFLSAIVYELFRRLREMIAETSHDEAKKWQVDNLRLFLLKIGATVKRRVRRVTISYSSAFAQQDLFRELMQAA
jgi:Transposase DDE domain group 1